MRFAWASASVISGALYVEVITRDLEGTSRRLIDAYLVFLEAQDEISLATPSTAIGRAEMSAPGATEEFIRALTELRQRVDVWLDWLEAA